MAITQRSRLRAMALGLDETGLISNACLYDARKQESPPNPLGFGHLN